MRSLRLMGKPLPVSVTSKLGATGKFVANSGLIVHPDYRNVGLAKKIKEAIFAHSRKKYPEAKVFGITTGLAVMKINSDLGYRPVTFSELTDDPTFWKGCQTCRNYDILQRTEQKMCLCTGMLYDPNEKKKIPLAPESPQLLPRRQTGPKEEIQKAKKTINSKAFSRLKSIKQHLFLKPTRDPLAPEGGTDKEKEK